VCDLPERVDCGGRPVCDEDSNYTIVLKNKYCSSIDDNCVEDIYDPIDIDVSKYAFELYLRLISYRNVLV